MSNGIFAECKNLYNIILPNSITTLGDYAFSNCTNLISIDASNIVSIGSKTF